MTTTNDETIVTVPAIDLMDMQPADADAAEPLTTGPVSLEELIELHNANVAELRTTQADLARIRQQRNLLKLALDTHPKAKLEHRLRTERNEAREALEVALAELAEARTERDGIIAGREEAISAYNRAIADRDMADTLKEMALDRVEQLEKELEEAKSAPVAPSEQPAPEAPTVQLDDKALPEGWRHADDVEYERPSLIDRVLGR